MDRAPQPTLFGYPTGLFNLFFAEMWERFSYYGMRSLLVFYMIKGFLGYRDGEAYAVYGAYTALVYMTPFFGGMLADRLLGARRGVIFGGLLMAAGHLLMGWESPAAFFGALALLIVGNGFFKPNISTIVGGLYAENDPRRDAGFTLFYIGINLGAAMSSLLCGYIGETWGYHYGFGLATLGMLIGLAVFVVPNAVAQVLILLGAIGGALALVAVPDGPILTAVYSFVAVALLVSGISAFMALRRGGLDAAAGQPKDPALLARRVAGLPLEAWVYLGTLAVVPIVAVLVWSTRAVRIVPESVLESFASGGTALRLVGFVLGEVSTPAGLLLTVVGAAAAVYLLVEAFRLPKIERERMFAVLVMMVFSMLFWAFFEQAGSSISNFTDRNVDRVFAERSVTPAEVGKHIDLTLTQEQLGLVNPDPSLKQNAEAAVRAVTELRLHELQGEELVKKTAELEATVAALRAEPTFTLTSLDALTQLDQLLAKSDAPVDRASLPANPLQQRWTVTPEHVGMGVNGTVVPASTFQSANAIYIMLFGLVFSTLWAQLGRRGIEPGTPVKFGLGLLQLGLGFGALWYGAVTADERGMVAMFWLLLAYLLHTTGELCLSPVGLSMVTRLSPARLVSTVMGAWFLATAFSNYLAAVIAALTGVEGDHGGGNFVPAPVATVGVYGGVFGQIAVAAIVSAGVMFAMSPLLKRWMHEDELPPAPAGGH